GAQRVETAWDGGRAQAGRNRTHPPRDQPRRLGGLDQGVPLAAGRTSPLPLRRLGAAGGAEVPHAGGGGTAGGGGGGHAEHPTERMYGTSRCFCKDRRLLRSSARPAPPGPSHTRG